MAYVPAWGRSSSLACVGGSLFQCICSPVLHWTGNEAWQIKQLFPPQWSSWLEIQAVSLSRLHIQNQGIFAPLIRVPPGPWSMGLWQRACSQKIKKDFLLSHPLRGVGRTAGDCSLHERVFVWLRRGSAMAEGWREAAPVHCRQGLCQTSAVHFAELQHCIDSREGSGRDWALRTSNFFFDSSHQVRGGDSKYVCLGGCLSCEGPAVCSQQRSYTRVLSTSSRSERKTSHVTNVVQLTGLLLNYLLSSVLMIQLSFAPAGPASFLTR